MYSGKTPNMTLQFQEIQIKNEPKHEIEKKTLKYRFENFVSWDRNLFFPLYCNLYFLGLFLEDRFLYIKSSNNRIIARFLKSVSVLCVSFKLEFDLLLGHE